MKKSVMTPEQKAKKAEANKAYRARKKEKEAAKTQEWMSMEKFEMAFDHKIRLYKTLRMELEHSYCASPGSVLNFTKISNENNLITFRVKRTGRRTFYTTMNELAPAQ
jgi:hypothetical protein